MDAFDNTFAVVLAFVSGIILVSGFWWSLSRLSRFLDGRKIVRMPGLGKNSTRVNVYLAGGTILENVKVVGTTQGSGKGMPYNFGRMVVLEDTEGLKTYIKSESIKMIKELADLNL